MEKKEVFNKVDEKTDAQVDELADAQVGEQADAQVGEQADAQVDEQLGGELRLLLHRLAEGRRIELQSDSYFRLLHRGFVRENNRKTKQ